MAAGTFFVHILSGYFTHPLVWWQYGIGAFLGASPDIDLCYAFFKKNANGHHEYLTHRPIVGIPFAVALGFLLGGTFWGTAAGVGVCWHYLHDTKGFLCLYDNGLGWFWPFSKKYWGVCNGRIVSETLKELLGKEESNFDSIYGKYLAPNRQSLTEFILTSIFLGYVLGDMFGFGFGVAAVFLFWFTITELWIAYHSVVSR